MQGTASPCPAQRENNGTSTGGFDLAGESYGINIAAVESIIKMQTITRLPQAPYPLITGRKISTFNRLF
ncbi:MAG: chemotaxis protein CheW [Chloroflexota bacterium]